MSERDDAAVTLRLTAEERRVVRTALEARVERLEWVAVSAIWAETRANAASDVREVRRVLALVTEDGDE